MSGLDEGLLSQVLQMLQGSLMPQYVGEATKAMEAQKGNGLFLEYLSIVFSGTTGSVPVSQAMDVRRSAGAILKVHMTSALGLLPPDAIGRVQGRVLAALGEVDLSAVAATLVSSLCRTLQDASDEIPLEALWPSLCPTLVEALDGALAGRAPPATAQGALAAIRMVSEDGGLAQTSPHPGTAPVYLLFPRLVQWMACPEPSTALAAARAAQSLVAETPECVGEPGALAPYMSALAALSSAHPTPRVHACVLGSMAALVEGLEGGCWGSVPAMLPFVCTALGRGEGVWEEATIAAAAVVKALAGAAGELDAGAGWSFMKDGAGGPGRGVLVPALPTILDALLKGMVWGEATLGALPPSQGGTGDELEGRGGDARNAAAAPVNFRAVGTHGGGGKGGGQHHHHHSSAVSASGDDEDKGDEGGEEDEDGDGEDDEDAHHNTVRNAFCYAFECLVDVYQKALLPAFLPLLQARLAGFNAAVTAAGGGGGGGGGGPGGAAAASASASASSSASSPPWLHAEAGILALGTVAGVCLDDLTHSVLPAVFVPLLSLLAPHHPPLLRATTAWTLGEMREWVHECDRQWAEGEEEGGGGGGGGGAGGPFGAGSGGAAGAALYPASAARSPAGVPAPVLSLCAALCGGISIPSPPSSSSPSTPPTFTTFTSAQEKVVLRCGSALVQVIGADPWACYSGVRGILGAHAGALSTPPPGASSSSSSPAHLAAGVGMRCRVWTSLHEVTDVLGDVISDPRDMGDVLGGLAEVLAGGIARVSACGGSGGSPDPLLSSREGKQILEAAIVVVAVAGEHGLGLCVGLGHLGLKMGQNCLLQAEVAAAAGVAAAAAAAAKGGGGGASGASGGAAAAGGDISQWWWEWDDLVTSLELQSTIVGTLSDVGGAFAFPGIGAYPETTIVTRQPSATTPASAEAARSALATLAPLFLGPQGVLLPSLDIQNSPSVTASAYGALGEMAGCSILWGLLEPLAPRALEMAVRKLALWAASPRGTPSSSNSSISNVLWSLGQIVAKLSPPTAAAVAPRVLPGFAAMLQRKSSAGADVHVTYANAALALCRLAAAGGAAAMLECMNSMALGGGAAAAAGSGSPATATAAAASTLQLLKDIFRASSLLEVPNELSDAARGIVALCTAGPAQCSGALPEALRFFAQVVALGDVGGGGGRGFKAASSGSASQQQQAQSPVPREVLEGIGRVLQGYKAAAGGGGGQWQSFLGGNLNDEATNSLKRAFPEAFKQ